MNNKEISKRLAILDAAAKAIEKKKRLHDPFLLCKPRGLYTDEFCLEYYPEGLFQKPRKTGPVPFCELVNTIRDYPHNMPCQISMGECTEWLFALHNYSDHSQIYSKEQRDRFIQEDLKRHPELVEILPERGSNIMETILKLPQSFTVSVGMLQDAISSNLELED